MTFLQGELKPLVEIIPPYKDTLGEYAIKLAGKAGLILDPWQEDSVNALMAINESGMWVCREYCEWVARQNGKGAILEARVLAGLFLLDEKMIIWSSHEFKTSEQAFFRIRELVRNLITSGEVDPGEIKIKSGHGDETFELPATGQMVKFIARSKGSGRGFTGNCNIIDETFGYTEIQEAAIRPTVSAIKNSQIIYTSTPPLNGIDSGPMYRLQERALSGKSPRLGYRHWAAVDPAITLDDMGKRDEETNQFKIDIRDRELWARANPACGIRIDVEGIEDELDGMAQIDFARERLCIFPRQMTGESGAIDYRLWLKLLNENSSRTGECAIGVDISPRHDAAAIGLYGDGSDYLGHMQLVAFNFGTSWIIEKLIDIREKINPIAFAMGKATFATLETALKEHGFELPDDEFKRGQLLILDAAHSAAAVGHMITAVNDGTMLVRPDARQPEVLNGAVQGAQFKEGADSVTWSRRGKSDVTPLIAVTNARYAFVTKKDNISDESSFFGGWR